jgi:hypothetical protein
MRDLLSIVVSVMPYIVSQITKSAKPNAYANSPLQSLDPKGCSTCFPNVIFETSAGDRHNRPPPTVLCPILRFGEILMTRTSGLDRLTKGANGICNTISRVPHHINLIENL